MTDTGALIPEGYDEFLRGLKERIRTAQVRAALAVNRELVLLYGGSVRTFSNGNVNQAGEAK
jgi:hypothetical protein